MIGPSTAAEPVVQWTDLGSMDYADALALQRELVSDRKEGRGADQLLTVEHPPVITLGRRGEATHVLGDQAMLDARGIRVFEVERGGDVTYHGPGQLVAYPILDLRGFRKDVRWFSTSLLTCMVRALGEFGIEAYTREGLETGVWVDDDRGPAKIGALGVRVERWVTYHGVALNVDPDMADYDLIVPCGLAGSRTASMAQVLGHPVTVAEAQAAFLRSFGAVFDVRLQQVRQGVPA